MLTDPVMGQKVACSDPNHERFGWVGLVWGWNSSGVGVQFPDDPTCPPTGRWLAKTKVAALKDADENLLDRVRRVDLQRNLLAKARESALAAIGAYNAPTASFRSGAYIVLMIIAWTSLRLAIFLRRGLDPCYPSEVRSAVPAEDEEPKFWDLAKSLREYYQGNEAAVAVNLRFFIGLRNRIAHGSMPELDATIFGECQAMLLNFETVLAAEFGDHHLLTDTLVYSLQFSRRNPTERQQAMRSIPGQDTTAVLEYVEKFRSSLSADILNSQEFSFRVFLVPQRIINPSRTVVAMEWVQYDPHIPEAMEHYAHIAALVTTKHIAVGNMGRLKPSDVCREVGARLRGKRFGQHEHTCCWRHYGVRPVTGSANPERCNTRFCHYDEVFKQYVYTQE
jgi:hypothetical protein